MNTQALRKRIQVATGKQPADLVIQNCKIVNVYTREILEGDIALSDGLIAGIGHYQGLETVDAKGSYAIPGLIEGHIHIESSMVSPEEFSRLLVPHGTTTVIADPHEIVNVCGIKGLNYMLDAAEKTALDIKYMLPSCVPCTPWEHAGAVIDAEAMKEPLKDERILGLGEFMNSVGVVTTCEDDLKKIALCQQMGKLVDGHAPGVAGSDLMGYLTAGIHTDHECTTVEEMQERIRNGMYVQLRQGSATQDIPLLVPGLNAVNARRCLLCSDDRQSATLLDKGDLDDCLRTCVSLGVDPVLAVQMATLNAAECYRLYDRGAIAPGLRGDIVLVSDLKEFHVEKVWIEGKLQAEDGAYLAPLTRQDITPVMGSIHVKDFSPQRLKLRLKSDRAVAMELVPGSLLTKKSSVSVQRDEEGDFVFDPGADIAKIAVVERHHDTGNVASALIKGYGIRQGAVAVTIAHDSHNIIVVGTSNEEMALAVETIKAQGGGAVLVKDGAVLGQLPLPIGGLMSDQSAEWVRDQLVKLHDLAFRELGVSRSVDPLMTLAFMSLPVIPEVKITDMGLFDVTAHEFISVG